MRSFHIFPLFVAGALAQRLSIASPAAGSTITAGTPFTVELHQDGAQGIVQQVSVIIALAPCFDVCDDPSQWSLSTVLFNGPFTPTDNASDPAAGLHQDFTFTLPEGSQTGGNALSVAHLLNVGAGLTPAFDYTDVIINVQ